MHLRSDAGETSTTGNGEPSSATIWPSAAISASKPSTSATIASSQGVAPSACATSTARGQRLAAMAAARVVMADEMRDADGAEPLRIGERRRRVVRVEAEAEVGSRALLLAERTRIAVSPAARRGGAPDTVSVTD